MKLSFGKRIVLFSHWLISVLILLAGTLFPQLGSWLETALINLFHQTAVEILYIVLIALYILLCAAVAYILVTHRSARSERGLITVDSAENGAVRIAVSAVEQMVKQAVTCVDGIAEMKIGVSSTDDAISIKVSVALVSGSHVPTVTLNMQRAIRQFVEMNCGVAVHSVSINIQAVIPADEVSRKGRHNDLKAGAVAVAVAHEAIPGRAEPKPVQDEPAVTEKDPFLFEEAPVLDPAADAREDIGEDEFQTAIADDATADAEETAAVPAECGDDEEVTEGTASTDEKKN